MAGRWPIVALRARIAACERRLLVGFFRAAGVAQAVFSVSATPDFAKATTAANAHDVVFLPWRKEATKICVHIADAPPHGIEPRGDNHPPGWDQWDPLEMARAMATSGITLYSVGCEPALDPDPEPEPASELSDTPSHSDRFSEKACAVLRLLT